LIDRGKLVVFSYSELTATISRGRQKAAPCVQNSDREAANLMPSNNVIAVIKAARETKTVGDALKLAVEVQHEHIDPVLVSLDAEIDHLDRYGKAQESRRCKVFRWALNGHVVFDVLGLAEHLDCII
jgi:hypothetical protein